MKRFLKLEEKLNKVKIVIAEDEILLRNNLKTKLSKLNDLNIELIGEACDGKDLIDLIETKNPDIVLTDIMMPEMDGLEVSRFINNNYPSIKIVIISGYSDFIYAQEALRTGVKDYLLKPVDIKDLKDVLKRMVEEIYSENGEIVSNSKSNKEQICESLINFLKNNYKEDISIAELSEKFGFSQEYLGKIFKKYTNHTISNYIIHLRIEEAKRLLVHYPEMEIYKIAELIGYKQNYFYFSRIFKNKTGLKPSEYRNLN